MSELEALVGGVARDDPEGWSVTWLEDANGIALVSDGSRRELVLAEGAASEWFVTVGGRRIQVAVRNRRERILAEAEAAQAGPHRSMEVTASLPGLVVGVRVQPGDEVGEGDALITIQAMKMENEIRAPRPGRVSDVWVAAGETVSSGQRLLRIE